MTANEIEYDDNGNMKKDLERNIVTIKYNSLNLPELIQFKNGKQIVNKYDAVGRKLATRNKTLYFQLAQPLNPGEVITGLDVSYKEDVMIEGTDYVGNIEYFCIQILRL